MHRYRQGKDNTKKKKKSLSENTIGKKTRKNCVK